MYYIYAHSKPNGSIFYIGKGKGSRAYKKHGRNAYWQSIVAKYGYETTILAYFDQETDAFQQEINCIQWLDDLCNLTIGGDGCSNPSPSTRLKMSRSAKGNTNCLGRKASDETKAKLSTIRKLRVFSDETKAKMSASQKDNMQALKGKTIAINILTGDRIEMLGNKQMVLAGFTPSLVSLCIQGKRPKHKGHTFTRESIARIV